MFDYHLHSNFSADCETPMENTIEAAIKKGLEKICFTEHIDIDYPDPTIDFDLDLRGYDKKINKMQQKYADQITIKKGVELGVQPHVLEDYEKIMVEETFDFVICSMHTTKGQGLHSRDLFKGRTVDEAYELYYTELLDCIKVFDQYSILGHLDLVTRYSEEESKQNFHEIIQEIFKLIIPQGKGIEVNTSGYAYGIGRGLPSEDILRLYKQCGGEIITLGSDSHVPETLASHFKESLQLLDAIGFKYIATFKNMEPTLHPIEQMIDFFRR